MHHAHFVHVTLLQLFFRLAGPAQPSGAFFSVPLSSSEAARRGCSRSRGLRGWRSRRRQVHVGSYDAGKCRRRIRPCRTFLQAHRHESTGEGISHCCTCISNFPTLLSKQGLRLMRLADTSGHHRYMPLTSLPNRSAL